MNAFEALCVALAARRQWRGPFGETFQARLNAEAYLLALEFNAEMPLAAAISAACQRIPAVIPTTLERAFADPHTHTQVRTLAKSIKEYNRRFFKSDNSLNETCLASPHHEPRPNRSLKNARRPD